MTGDNMQVTLCDRRGCNAQAYEDPLEVGLSMCPEHLSEYLDNLVEAAVDDFLRRMNEEHEGYSRDAN